MTLIVKEVFKTLQGEGFWSGTPSIFVRLAGCNLWSGREGHRVRDATRTGARCPLFCDTDFVGGTPYTGTELAVKIAELAGSKITHVVFTGGEPLLQIERKHIVALRKALPDVRVAVETNGTVAPKTPGGVYSGIDWICLSPKLPPSQLEIDRGDEIKVVFPAYDPLEYEELASKFTHRFVSPEAPSMPGYLATHDVLSRAVEFCLKHPQWRLSLQAHKYLEIP